MEYIGMVISLFNTHMFFAFEDKTKHIMFSKSVTGNMLRLLQKKKIESDHPP